MSLTTFLPFRIILQNASLHISGSMVSDTIDLYSGNRIFGVYISFVCKLYVISVPMCICL